MSCELEKIIRKSITGSLVKVTTANDIPAQDLFLSDIIEDILGDIRPHLEGIKTDEEFKEILNNWNMRNQELSQTWEDRLREKEREIEQLMNRVEELKPKVISNDVRYMLEEKIATERIKSDKLRELLKFVMEEFI